MRSDLLWMAAASLAVMAACGAQSPPRLSSSSTASPSAAPRASASPRASEAPAPAAAGSAAAGPAATGSNPASPLFVPSGPLPTADAHGDALPTGARLRLGTLRHRKPPSTARLFLSDQASLIAWTLENEAIAEVDVTTGQTLRTMKRAGWGRTLEAPHDRSFLFARRGLKVEKRNRKGKVVRTFAMPPGATKPGEWASINASDGFRISHGGARLAAWAEHLVVLYDVGSGAMVGRHKVPAKKGHVLKVRDVAADHVVVCTEQEVFLMSRESSCAVWDLKRRKERFSVDGDISLSADGRHAAVFDRAASEIQFRTVEGVLLERDGITVGRGMGPLHLSGDGARLAWHESDAIHIYSTQPLKEQEATGPGTVRALSPNGRHMAVERNGFIHVVSTTKVNLPEPPAGHTDRIKQLTFSPDGRVLSSLSSRGWRMWNLETGKAERSLEPPSQAATYEFVEMAMHRTAALRGRKLLLSRPDEAVPTKVVATDVSAFALGDDGFAALHGESGMIDNQRIAWHNMTGQEVWSIDVNGVNYLAVTPQYVLGSGDDRLGVHNRSTGRLISQLEGVSGPMTVVGDRLFVDSHGVVELAYEGGVLRPLRRMGEPRHHVAISLNGQRFAFEDKGVIVVRDASGIIGRFPKGHSKSFVTALAFSPDGRQLASGADDGTVLVWDLGHLPAWAPAASPMRLRPIGNDLRQPDPHCLVDVHGVAKCSRLRSPLPGASDLHELWVEPYDDDDACAVMGAARALVCWKRESYPGPYIKQAVPKIVGAQQVAGTGAGGCVIDGNAEAVCWGRPLGLHIPKNKARWTFATDVAQLGMGWFFACVRKKGDGSVWCGGSGRHALGSHETQDDRPPRKIEGLGGAAVDLAVGHEHACAVLADGAVRCWGEGEDFTLGDGSGLSAARPVKVELEPAASVQLSEYLSCALTKGGELWCWGRHKSLGAGLGVAATPERIATGVDELGGVDGVCLRRGHEWSCL